MVSLVYVSYNNPGILIESIQSIKKFNHKYDYNFIVVAYMYTEENFIRLKNEVSDIIIINRV